MSKPDPELLGELINVLEEKVKQVNNLKNMDPKERKVFDEYMVVLDAKCNKLFNELFDNAKDFNLENLK